MELSLISKKQTHLNWQTSHFEHALEGWKYSAAPADGGRLVRLIVLATNEDATTQPSDGFIDTLSGLPHHSKLCVFLPLFNFESPPSQNGAHWVTFNSLLFRGKFYATLSLVLHVSVLMFDSERKRRKENKLACHFHVQQLAAKRKPGKQMNFPTI